MSTPRARVRSVSPQWLVNIPELETRPTLLNAICYMHYIARRCLNLWWKETMPNLQRYYHDRLRQETGTDLLFNELVGCMRNVLTNMKRKAGCLCVDDIYHNEHDIVRRYTP